MYATGRIFRFAKEEGYWRLMPEPLSAEGSSPFDAIFTKKNELTLTVSHVRQEQDRFSSPMDWRIALLSLSMSRPVDSPSATTLPPGPTTV